MSQQPSNQSIPYVSTTILILLSVGTIIWIEANGGLMPKMLPSYVVVPAIATFFIGLVAWLLPAEAGRVPRFWTATFFVFAMLGLLAFVAIGRS